MPASKKTIIAPGTKFNQLTVLKLLGSDSKNKRLYQCQCDCGKTMITRASKIKTGYTKSCGCAKKCSQEHPLGAGFSAAIAAYKSTAQARKLGWSLTTEQFHEITQKPCHYCGELPQQISKKSQSNGRVYIYNGIDRVDSSKGYHPDNIVPCCKQCNRAKQCLSQTEFFDLIKKIYALHCTAARH